MIPSEAEAAPLAPTDPTPGEQVEEQTLKRRVIRWMIGGLVVSLVLGLALDRLFGRLIRLEPEAITEWFDQLGGWAPVVYIGAMIGAVVFSPIPSLPLDIAAGLAFGLFRGTVYTLIGAEIGAIIAFLIARKIGRPRLAARLSPSTMQQIDDLTQRMGVRAIILMRLVPLFNFDWVSYAAGLTSMSLTRFAVATLIGMTPTVIAITAVGSTASANPRISVFILGGLMLLFAAPIVVAVVQGLRNRRSKSETHA